MPIILGPLGGRRGDLIVPGVVGYSNPGAAAAIKCIHLEARLDVVDALAARLDVVDALAATLTASDALAAILTTSDALAATLTTTDALEGSVGEECE